MRYCAGGRSLGAAVECQNMQQRRREPVPLGSAMGRKEVGQSDPPVTMWFQIRQAGVEQVCRSEWSLPSLREPPVRTVPDRQFFPADSGIPLPTGSGGWKWDAGWGSQGSEAARSCRGGWRVSLAYVLAEPSCQVSKCF